MRKIPSWIKEKVEKSLLPIFFFFVLALSSLSLLIIIVLAYEAIKEFDTRGIDISSKGIENFIEYFLPFKEILGATITVIGIYLLIRRVQIMMDSNKIASRKDWHDKLERLLNEKIGANHKEMVNYLSVNAKEIHDYLFITDMVIKDREHLNDFFNKFISKGIVKFEKNSSEYRRANIANQLYQFNITAYSYLGYFSKITDYVARPSIYYHNLTADLKELYIAEVDRQRQSGNL